MASRISKDGRKGGVEQMEFLFRQVESEDSNVDVGPVVLAVPKEEVFSDKEDDEEFPSYPILESIVKVEGEIELRSGKIISKYVKIPADSLIPSCSQSGHPSTLNIMKRTQVQSGENLQINEGGQSNATVLSKELLLKDPKLKEESSFVPMVKLSEIIINQLAESSFLKLGNYQALKHLTCEDFENNSDGSEDDELEKEVRKLTKRSFLLTKQHKNKVTRVQGVGYGDRVDDSSESEGDAWFLEEHFRINPIGSVNLWEEDDFKSETEIMGRNVNASSSASIARDDVGMSRPLRKITKKRKEGFFYPLDYLRDKGKSCEKKSKKLRKSSDEYPEDNEEIVKPRMEAACNVVVLRSGGTMFRKVD